MFKFKVILVIYQHVFFFFGVKFHVVANAFWKKGSFLFFKIPVFWKRKIIKKGATLGQVSHIFIPNRSNSQWKILFFGQVLKIGCHVMLHVSWDAHHWCENRNLKKKPCLIEFRVPVILLCEIFIPSYEFDALLCWNWPFSPPNCETLRITLLYALLWNSSYYMYYCGLCHWAHIVKLKGDILFSLSLKFNFYEISNDKN